MREQVCGAPPLVPPKGRPRSLVRTVLRGLAPLPDDRWPSMTALADALEPRSPVVPWVASGGVVATAALVAFFAATGDEPCSQVEQPLGAVWNEETRTSIAGAFARTDRDYAEEAWARG